MLGARYARYLGASSFKKMPDGTDLCSARKRFAGGKVFFQKATMSEIPRRNASRDGVRCHRIKYCNARGSHYCAICAQVGQGERCRTKGETVYGQAGADPATMYSQSTRVHEPLPANHPSITCRNPASTADASTQYARGRRAARVHAAFCRIPPYSGGVGGKDRARALLHAHHALLHAHHALCV